MSDSILLKARFAAAPESLKPMRAALASALGRAGCTQEDVRDIVVAVNEACMNVIQHAYGNGCRCAIREFVLDVDKIGADVEIRITDFADPVNPAHIKPRSLDEVRPGGLGVHFIHAIMDEVCFTAPDDGQGNRLVMKKRCQ